MEAGLFGGITRKIMQNKWPNNYSFHPPYRLPNVIVQCVDFNLIHFNLEWNKGGGVKYAKLSKTLEKHSVAMYG